MGKKAPAAPDPFATAQAQAQFNQQTAATQQAMNMVDQYNPWVRSPMIRLALIRDLQQIMSSGSKQQPHSSPHRRPSQRVFREFYRQQAGEALPYEQWDMSRRRSGATNVTQVTGGEPLSPGQKKIDEAFADTYLEWAQSGSAESQKNIGQLNEAINLLSPGRNITGVVGLLPAQLQAFVNPDGTIARNNVESVVQLTLKQILGAQFAMKEGEQVLARAFNPLLPRSLVPYGQRGQPLIRSTARHTRN